MASQTVLVVEPKSNHDILKLVGIGALSIGLNFLIFGKLFKKKSQGQAPDLAGSQKKIMTELLIQEKNEMHLIKQSKKQKTAKKEQQWGSIKLIGQYADDPLLKQLKLMDSLLFEVSRVNHLIIDLELKDFKPFKNPLIARQVKRNKQEPFMSTQTIVAPGQFILKQCKFTPGNTLQLQKKYIRAGPRASQFFKATEVRADIVCLGSVCPGMNTVIRELVIMLKDVYNVNRVTGVKHGFKGYYEKRFLDMNTEVVETIHHYGGCYLGLSEVDFNASKVVDSLVQRGVNQVYLVGANKTMRACHTLHDEIKKKKLPIAVCVLLKGINRDIPIFDSCFGFDTAVEESSKVIQKAYAYSHSNENGISLVKLPGYNSGFLATHAVLSTVNSNICLVPEFQFDIYGKKGLLEAISWRIRNKGSCTIVYSEGAQNALRDCCIKKSKKWESITEFDNFLRSQIQQMMRQQNFVPFQIGIFNAIEVSRSSPANSIDTKLVCQIAQASVMGVMAGYTNFAVGHLANKSAMISVDELIMSESVTQLKEHDEIWQQTLMTTGQPRMLNDQLVIKTPPV